jgi:hypothetical protein
MAVEEELLWKPFAEGTKAAKSSQSFAPFRDPVVVRASSPTER